jgi:hypothetical protein
VTTQLADLCRGLTREFPEANFDSLVEDAVLEVDGVAMGIDADDESAVENLTLFVDIGAVNPERKLDVLARARAFNLSGESEDHGVIDLDEEDNHLVLTNTLSWPAVATAAELARVLRQLAGFANDFEQRLQAGALARAPAGTGLNLGIA